MHTIKWFSLLAVTVLTLGCASLSDDPTKDWPVERLYGEANRLMADGSFTEAIKMYETLLSRFPYGRHAEQSQLEMAFCFYKSEEPALAVATLDRFLRLYPTHPNADYAYYLKGIVNFSGERSLFDWLLGGADERLADRDQKSLRDAYNAYRELVERYPKSRYAPDAAKRMAFLFNTQAQHEVSVAQFYFDRKAYVAAVNRCKYTLENYPRTPATEEALVIQARSYKMMGLEDLMRDTLRILRMNFPKSAYIAELEALSASAGS